MLQPPDLEPAAGLEPPYDHECCPTASPTPDRSGRLRPGVPVSFKVRLGLFLLLTTLVVGFAIWLLLPPTRYSADLQLQISMSGYNPGTVTISAGQPTTVELVNSESPFHDGGGLHNFVAPELGIATIIPAKSSVLVTLPALPAGTYTFYCDVCCGGKENPTMRGTLVVKQAGQVG